LATSKAAARQIAFAEDSAIFEGYTAAGIVGVRQGTSDPQMPLPADVRQYPDAIAQALSQLRLVGVNGPYAVLLGADAYTALAETSDQGCCARRAETARKSGPFATSSSKRKRPGTISALSGKAVQFLKAFSVGDFTPLLQRTAG
jgi:uncharacterized linocin/CFP29 family protein